MLSEKGVRAGVAEVVGLITGGIGVEWGRTVTTSVGPGGVGVGDGSGIGAGVEVDVGTAVET